MRFIAIVALSSVVLVTSGARTLQTEIPDIDLFFEAAVEDDRQARKALDQIAAAWKDSYASLIVDLARFMKPAARQLPEIVDEAPPPTDEEPIGAGRGLSRRTETLAKADPSSKVRERLIWFLQKQTRQNFGDNLDRWRKWIWKLPYEPHPDYLLFKGMLYERVEGRMSNFFPPGVRSLIRLDEVDWGGVAVNGIPPLDHPKRISATEARYLKDSNIVFGIVMNGEARAYPKRILAWHELARDRIGGVELTIVYCTLCGTVIPYESVVGGQLRTFGTSGLLYRSNKLMFDEETSSLWSTLEGKPVIGRLVGSGLELRAHGVVTTTWGEWRAEHPDTTVLSLETGYKRDYSEGAAYRDYFSTDRLMFQVPETDSRLKNKAEVLVMLLAPKSDSRAMRIPVAIAADFLKKNPVYHAQAAGHELVVVTSPSGANRVYGAGSARFVRRLPDGRIEDAQGRAWNVNEEALVADHQPATRLPRIPAQRAFWFGWYAQFPNTVLIK